MDTAQEVLGDRQQVSFIWRKKPEIAYLDEAFWEYMLKKTADKIDCRQGCSLALPGAAVFKPESNVAVFQFFDAVVGNSDSIHIGGEIF